MLICLVVSSETVLQMFPLLQLRLLKAQIDDPVGAIGVHGTSAIWGLLAVGLFADGSLPGCLACWKNL